MAVRVSTPEQMRDLMVAENARINALVDRLKLKQD